MLFLYRVVRFIFSFFLATVFWAGLLIVPFAFCELCLYGGIGLAVMYTILGIPLVLWPAFVAGFFFQGLGFIKDAASCVERKQPPFYIGVLPTISGEKGVIYE